MVIFTLIQAQGAGRQDEVEYFAASNYCFYSETEFFW